eukprot:817023-Rhodomonas_salina.1
MEPGRCVILWVVHVRSYGLFGAFLWGIDVACVWPAIALVCMWPVVDVFGMSVACKQVLAFMENPKTSKNELYRVLRMS